MHLVCAHLLTVAAGNVLVPRRAPALRVPGARGRRSSRVPGAEAFTLLELLAVMALLAILSGSAFGLVRGVHERAAIARARAELAVLAQAIDSWRGQYGVCPSAATAEELFESLTGRRGPQNNLLDPPGRTFIEVGRFTLRSPDAMAPGNALLDPWGQPYHYVFFSRASSGRPVSGYVVFSSGPDGRAKPDDPPVAGPKAGEPDLTAPDNADNLYSYQ